MDTTHLSQAFQDGLKIEDPFFGEITLRHCPLGELMLTTGQVIACDPIVYPGTKPFNMTLSPGRYPVVACVAEFASHGYHEVAYAILQLTEQEPARWEIATKAGQDASKLEEGHIFCYPVDAGTGCFMDVDAAAAFQRRLDEDPDYCQELIYSYNDYLNLPLNPATGANAIFFTSGWGDGFYASYWGYDAEDNIVCLITDFSLLGHPIFSSNSGRPSGKLKTLARRLLHL